MPDPVRAQPYSLVFHPARISKPVNAPHFKVCTVFEEPALIFDKGADKSYRASRNIPSFSSCRISAFVGVLKVTSFGPPPREIYGNLSWRPFLITPTL